MDALRQLNEALSDRFVVERELGGGGMLTYAYTALGDADAAFRWLERAFEACEPDVVFSADEPFSIPLRNDPRFRAFVRRLWGDSPS